MPVIVAGKKPRPRAANFPANCDGHGTRSDMPTFPFTLSVHPFLPALHHAHARTRIQRVEFHTLP